VFGFGFVTPGFMPESARPQFVVDMYLPQGTDIRTTAEELAEAEATSAASPASPRQQLCRPGRAAFHADLLPEDPNSSYGQLLVDVDDPADRSDPGRRAAGRAGLAPSGGRRQGLEVHARARRRQEDRGRLPRTGPGVSCAGSPNRPNPSWPRTPAPWPSRTTGAEGAGTPPGRRRGRGPARRCRCGQVSAALNRALSGQQVGVYREGDTLVPIISRAPGRSAAGCGTARQRAGLQPTAQRHLPVGQLIDGVEVVWVDAIIPPGRWLPDHQGPGRPACPASSPAPLLASATGDRGHRAATGLRARVGRRVQGLREANEGLAPPRPSASRRWSWRSSSCSTRCASRW
jgi:hypothetical protein